MNRGLSLCEDCLLGVSVFVSRDEVRGSVGLSRVLNRLLFAMGDE